MHPQFTTPLGIPEALRARAQWVCHVRKVPCQPDGRPASTTDPATWSPFTVCLEAVTRGRAGGLGYVFSPADPYTGVDLDHVRAVDTGALEPRAREVIALLCSYSEVSPSGSGIHIIIEAVVPPGGNRRGQVEMYSAGRYFTMTGAHLAPTPTTIEARQAELATLHARMFPSPPPPPVRRKDPPPLALEVIMRRLFGARNRDKVRMLWHSSGAAGYQSPSEADLALISEISYWTKDPTQIDALFRSSNRMRDDWDEKHGKYTLGERAIRKALDQTS